MLQILTLLLVLFNGLCSLIVVKVPDGDGKTKSRRLGDLMRIALIREEKNDPVELWLDICHDTVIHLGKKSQDASITLLIVVLVEVINTGYATT